MQETPSLFLGKKNPLLVIDLRQKPVHCSQDTLTSLLPQLPGDSLLIHSDPEKACCHRVVFKIFNYPTHFLALLFRGLRIIFNITEFL